MILRKKTDSVAFLGAMLFTAAFYAVAQSDDVTNAPEQEKNKVSSAMSIGNGVYSRQNLPSANVREGVSTERSDEIMKIINNYLRSGEQITDPDVRKAIFADVAKKMELQPKNPPDNRTFSEIADLSREIVDARFKDDPVELKKHAWEEAEKKFKMHQILDPVEVHYTKGKNSYTAKGIFYGYGGRSIRVDENYIAIFDMVPETRVKFDEEFNRQKKREYVEAKVKEYSSQKIQYSQKVFKSLREKQVKKNEDAGYIYAWKEWRSPQQITELYLSIKKEQLQRQKTAELQLAQRRAMAARAEAERNGEILLPAMPGMSGEGGRPSGAMLASDASMTGTVQDSFSGRVGPNALSSSSSEEATKAQEKKNEPEVMTPAKQKAAAEELKYAELMEKVNNRLREIANTCYGIDADQGYKKALWNLNRSEVSLILRHDEPPTSVVKSAMFADIVSNPNALAYEVELHYMDNVLVKVIMHYANVTFANLPVFRNSLHEQYGRSDEEKTNPEAMNIEPGEELMIVEEDLDDDGDAPLLLPRRGDKNTPAKNHSKSKKEKEEEKAPQKQLNEKFFHWTGTQTTGTLRILMNEKGDKILAVTFTKEATALIQHLKERSSSDPNGNTNSQEGASKNRLRPPED